jgi:hypothetical protein
MSKVDAPTLSVAEGKIVIKITESPAMTPVVAKIFLVVGMADVTPAKDIQSGNTNASGNLTLTSIVLPAGTYHVQSSITIPGRTNPEVFDGEVIIPVPVPVPGGGGAD